MNFGEIFRVLKRFENFEIQKLGHNELVNIQYILQM